MYIYSARSKKRLQTCDIRLQNIFKELLTFFDHTIVCGYRNEKDQNAAFKAGNSKLRWPQSRHNEFPSLAVDIIPYPSGWNEINSFYFMAGAVKAIAKRHGIKIRWGGDWSMDNDFNDQTFMDLGHFEIYEPAILHKL